MFQVVTGDSWASAVTRTLFKEDGAVDVAVALFFVSYVIIAGIQNDAWLRVSVTGISVQGLS